MNVNVNLIKVTPQEATYQVSVEGHPAYFEFTVPQAEFYVGLSSAYFVDNIHRGVALLRALDPDYHADFVLDLINGPD